MSPGEACACGAEQLIPRLLAQMQNIPLTLCILPSSCPQAYPSKTQALYLDTEKSSGDLSKWLQEWRREYCFTIHFNFLLTVSGNTGRRITSSSYFHVFLELVYRNDIQMPMGPGYLFKRKHCLWSLISLITCLWTQMKKNLSAMSTIPCKLCRKKCCNRSWPQSLCKWLGNLTSWYQILSTFPWILKPVLSLHCFFVCEY